MTLCRHCGQPMTVHGVQHYPPRYNMKPIVEIHCLNRGCPLWTQTFDEATYPTKDLTPYLSGSLPDQGNI